jgi:hypothetical protein
MFNHVHLLVKSCLIDVAKIASIIYTRLMTDKVSSEVEFESVLTVLTMDGFSDFVCCLLSQEPEEMLILTLTMQHEASIGIL